MSFGKWLVARRNEARLTQQQLAERAGISPNYVSALERDEPNARDGSPRRPRVDKVEKLAKVLKVPVDDALLAAGYAPRSVTVDLPTTIPELMTALKRLGIDVDHIEPFNLEPVDYAKLLDDIRLVIELRANRR